LDLIHKHEELTLLQYLPDWKQIPIWNPYRRIFYTFDCSTCQCAQVKAEMQQQSHMKAIEMGVTTTSTRVMAKKIVTRTGPDGKVHQVIMDVDNVPDDVTSTNKSSKRSAKSATSLTVDLPGNDHHDDTDMDIPFDGSIIGLLSRGCTPLLNVAIEHPRNILKTQKMPITLTSRQAQEILSLIESNSPLDTSKQTILTSIPYFLYLHVLSLLDRHDVSISVASRLIHNYFGLPFAKAIDNRLNNDLVSSAVDWFNTTCTRNTRGSLGDLGQLYNGACALTSIIARSPTIPVLLETNILPLYRRLTGEIQSVLNDIVNNPEYIPDGYKDDELLNKKLSKKTKDLDSNMTAGLRKAKINEAVNKANGLHSALTQLIKTGIQQDAFDTSGKTKPLVVYANGYKPLLAMLSEFATKYS